MYNYDFQIDLAYQWYVVFPESLLVVNYPVTPQSITTALPESHLEDQEHWYRRALSLSEGEFTLYLSPDPPFLVTLATPIIQNKQAIGVIAV